MRRNMSKSQAIVSIAISIVMMFFAFSMFTRMHPIQDVFHGGSSIFTPFLLFMVIWFGILFSNIVRSIIVLVRPQKDDSHHYTTINDTDAFSDDSYYQSNVNNKKRLEELEHLYNSGLITKKEYDHKRESIINQL